MEMQYNNWQIEIDAEQIAWLGMDKQDENVNSMNDAVLDELNTITQELAKIDNLRGLVILSSKKKGFIAGADIHVFGKLASAEEAFTFISKGQAVFARIESLNIPTVAMINGFCMGGGFELALACDYRIASIEPDTKLALPEILLGFHPGWGGTVRLPKIVGAFTAITKVILTGKSFGAKQAKSIGMVDDAVPLRQLKRAARYYINNKPKKQRKFFSNLMFKLGFARSIAARIIRTQLVKKANKAHYPAFYAVLDLWEKEGGKNNERAYHKEALSVQNLVIGDSQTASNLIKLFFCRDKMKAFAKNIEFKAESVHIIGAGVMGGDIAAWCALKGLRVTLQDQSYNQIGVALGRAYKLFNKKLRDKRLVQAAMDRICPDQYGYGVSKACVIIEAVSEHLDLKRKILNFVELHARSDAIIATNTSSIPLDEMNVVMQNPERLVGIHFFNPVAKMELVEIVRGDVSADAWINKSCAFVNQIGKLPLPVKSSPGFLVNRVLMPYLLECMNLIQEGLKPEVIDYAAKAFGMMMGPVELADTVGLDVCLLVADNLTQHYGGEVPTKLRDYVEQGRLGRKTNKGFYTYNKKGKPVLQSFKVPNNVDEIAQRLINAIVAESKTCLAEEVVASADLLDGGMVFATGFAPFRGGPLHYLEAPVG
jgi:3-hydroxyacyl-CoA dehydrogenase / enoyl-CoA hydratase / 3-hydroxybutyryl-CoA epimerase